MVVAQAHTTIVHGDAVAGRGMQIEAARQLFRSRAVDNRHTFRRRRSSVIMAKSMTDVALHDAAVNCATGVVWALLELRGLLTSKQLDSAHQDRVLHGGSTAQASASGAGDEYATSSDDDEDAAGDGDDQQRHSDGDGGKHGSDSSDEGATGDDSGGLVIDLGFQSTSLKPHTIVPPPVNTRPSPKRSSSSPRKRQVKRQRSTRKNVKRKGKLADLTQSAVRYGLCALVCNALVHSLVVLCLTWP